MSVSAGTRTTVPPSFIEEDSEWKRKASSWMLEANQGHLNNVGTVTLLSGTVSTVVSDMRIGINSFIGLMPTTANAAGGLATTFILTTAGTFTLTHANAATGDRTFRYTILG